MFYSKPWIRKVRTSRGHLSVERRTILETWYTFYFFRNKTFLFVKIDSWNFQHLFDLEFRETSQNVSSFPIENMSSELFPKKSKKDPKIQTTDRKNRNKNCLNELNELKFCEVSRNPKSNRCWKFQLSILTNKKVLFLKKYELSRSQTKRAVLQSRKLCYVFID